MIAALDILSCGAVSCVGLDALQTAAAFRARLAGFSSSIVLTPPSPPRQAARVPANGLLKRSQLEWLVSLACRSISETLHYRSDLKRIGLSLAVPETMRRDITGIDGQELVDAIKRAAPPAVVRVAVGGEGGAGFVTGLERARELIQESNLDACLAGGADSLLDKGTVDSLRACDRMLEPGNPKGFVPGEGSAFLLVAPAGRYRKPIARIIGGATDWERDHVLGSRLSQGRAFAAALAATMQDGGIPESEVSFRVSTINGEQYAVWESMFFATRFYRTRREQLPIWYAASTIGETGAASGAFAGVLAALAIAGGYAPGPYAMCESASDSGARGAIVIGPALGALDPPFRPEAGSSMHIRRMLGK